MDTNLVLKNVDYASKRGGGTIDSANELNLLEEGAIAIVANGKVLTSADDIKSIKNTDEIFIAVGYPTTERDLLKDNNIKITGAFNKRNFVKLTETEPITAVAKSIIISDFTDSVGEAFIKLYVKGLDVTNSLQRYSVSLVRKESETISTFVDRIIAKFNSGSNTVGFKLNNTLATVEKVTKGDKAGIKFTAIDPSADLEVAVDGLFADATVTIATDRVLALGQGYQVKKQESESSAMFGDSGFESNDYFNRVTNTDTSKEYKSLDIQIQRTHHSPTNVQNSMFSNFTIFAQPDNTALPIVKDIFAALDSTNATDSVE